MVGQWKSDGRFAPAATQPAGKAAREVEALKAWFRQPETIKALLAEGAAVVSTVRSELVTAEFKTTEVVKAKVT